MSSKFQIEKSTDNGETWGWVSFFGKQEFDTLDEAHKHMEAMATPTSPLWRIVEKITTRKVVSTIEYMGVTDEEIVASVVRRSNRR